jgi:hypothetical protein
MRRRLHGALVAALCVAIFVGSSVFFLTRGSDTTNALKPGCENISNYGRQARWSFVCGQSTVSDRYLTITVPNYHFANGKDIQFAEDPSSVFLLANVTVENIGSENGPVDAVWFAILLKPKFQNKRSK